MHIENLKKAHSLFQQLEILDEAIKQIEKYACSIKDQDAVIVLKLSQFIQEKDSGTIEADRLTGISGFHTVFRDMEAFMNPFAGVLRSHQPNKKEDFNMEISEVIALQVLGVMIAHKEAERMYIINQLNSMGFEVNI